MEQLEKLLRSHSQRLTEPRKQVFLALEQAGRPLSLQELTTAANGIERTSVYRTLALFDQIGIIEILYVGWKKRYELASPFQPHHHHLQCTNCHRMVEIDIPALEKTIEKFARTQGYALTSHNIELLGICADCQKLPR